MEEKLAGLLRYYGLAKPGKPVHVTVMSFSALAVRRVRELVPDVDAVWLTEWATPGLRNGQLPFGARIGGPGVRVVRHNPGIVEKLHKNGHKVYVWTVDTPEDFDLMVKLGVDGIISNRPRYVLDRLGRYSFSSRFSLLILELVSVSRYQLQDQLFVAVGLARQTHLHGRGIRRRPLLRCDDHAGGRLVPGRSGLNVLNRIIDLGLWTLHVPGMAFVEFGPAVGRGDAANGAASIGLGRRIESSDRRLIALLRDGRVVSGEYDDLPDDLRDALGAAGRGNFLIARVAGAYARLAF